jgi:hypothetical protein
MIVDEVVETLVEEEEIIEESSAVYDNSTETEGLSGGIDDSTIIETNTTESTQSV